MACTSTINCGYFEIIEGSAIKSDLIQNAIPAITGSAIVTADENRKAGRQWSSKCIGGNYGTIQIKGCLNAIKSACY